MKMAEEYAFFWGCMIPWRYPFIEASTRQVFEKLDIQIKDTSDNITTLASGTIEFSTNVTRDVD